MNLKADLHMHTTCSDGTFTPSEVVDRAKKNGIDIIAITDHDTIDGITEAVEHGNAVGVRVIPGIELSTTFNKENVHILGFFKGDNYKDISLKIFLKDLQEKRYDRAKKIVENLERIHNIVIPFENIIKGADGVIARPHIAREILKVKPELSWDDVFNNYLKDGAPAYIPSVKVPLEEGIKLLKKYNAAVFLAHPVILRKTPVKDFTRFAFDGVECIYPENTPNQTKKYKKMCREKNLLFSAGSDFHGNLTQDTMHHDIGTVFLEGEDLNSFLNFVDF